MNNDEGSMSLSAGLDVVETREASSDLSSVVSNKEEVLSFHDPTIPVERDMDFTIPMPSMPKQMDEFLSLLTETEPSELSKVVSSAIPTVPSESEALISKRVSAEPSESEALISKRVSAEPSESEALISKRVSAEPSEIGMLSTSSIAAPGEHDRLLSSQTPTTPRELEDTFTIVKSATSNEEVEESAGLNPTETRSLGDAVPPAFSVMAPTEAEKIFAKFSLPGRGEIYESRATASTGYGIGWTINPITIGRIEAYLPIAALLVFVASLLIYWMLPFENVSSSPEVITQHSAVSRPRSDLQTTVVEGNPGTKQGRGIEWHSAFEPGSGDRSLDEGVRGSTSDNSLPNSAASNPSRLATMEPTEPAHLDREKPVPTRKREKAEKKKVTVEDLITDKKKVTVDDLINDN